MSGVDTIADLNSRWFMFNNGQLDKKTITLDTYLYAVPMRGRGGNVPDRMRLMREAGYQFNWIEVVAGKDISYTCMVKHGNSESILLANQFSPHLYNACKDTVDTLDKSNYNPEGGLY